MKRVQIIFDINGESFSSSLLYKENPAQTQFSAFEYYAADSYKEVVWKHFVCMDYSYYRTYLSHYINIMKNKKEDVLNAFSI